jgi:hypothetical protein
VAALGDEMAELGELGDEIVTSKEQVISYELRLFRSWETSVSVVPKIPSHHIFFSLYIVLYYNKDYVS